MTTAGSVTRLEPAQHAAAKVAGVMYLFTIVAAVFSEFYARGQLVVSGDARSIATSVGIFRLGIVSDLIEIAGVVILLVALYVVLRPVNRNAALLAAAWRLVECSVFALIVLNDFVALKLLSGADYLQAFDAKQLQALARVFVSVHGDGYLLGLVFFGLGSTVFAYLWLRSRYIPQLLAAWGIFASSLVFVVTLAVMAFPTLADVVMPAYFAPIFVFEAGLGIWLLVKGIRAAGPSSDA